MYHWVDYLKFIWCRRNKIVFWAGGDIVNLRNNRIGWIKMFKLFKAKHFCENYREVSILKILGIDAIAQPIFLEDPNDFPITFKATENPHVFMNCHPGREAEYGLLLIPWVAKNLPSITFHIYGEIENQMYYDIMPNNVTFHGRVPNEQFNEDIKNYQCGLRLNDIDGFSGITAKSILSGGYPLTRIHYEMLDSVKEDVNVYNNSSESLYRFLKELKYKTRPNLKAREYWFRQLSTNHFLDVLQE